MIESEEKVNVREVIVRVSVEGTEKRGIVSSSSVSLLIEHLVNCSSLRY